MIGLPSGAKVWIATGHTDMRKGLIGLAGMVKQTLLCDPMSGHLFVFRGRKGDRIKVLWWDGQGMCLFYKLLSVVTSFGHRVIPVKSSSHRRSWRCYWKGLTGGF